MNRWQAIALSAGIGLVGVIALVLADDQAELDFNEPTVHVVLISLSVVITAALAVLSLRAFLLTGTYRTLALGAAFVAFAAVYMWHGLFTQSGHPFAFLIYGPSSRLAFALAFVGFALPGAVSGHRRYSTVVGVVAAGILVAIIGFLVHDPMSAWAMKQQPSTFTSIRLTVEGLACGTLAVGFAHVLYRDRRTATPTSPAILAAVVFLTWQTVFFMVTSAWTLTWWAAHALGAFSTLLLAGAVIVQANTHQKAAELARFKELNVMKSTFINTAAHELSTPLTPIMLQMRMLSRSSADFSPAQQRSIKILEQNLARLKLLVHRILDGSKSMAGRLVLAHEEYDLGRTVAAVVDAYSDLAMENGVICTIDAPETVHAWGDQHRVEQVIGNALDNAIKYTPEGGTIHCAMTLGKHDAVVSIVDSGVGMSPALQEQLFQPFAKGSHADPQVEGSGLGLFLSRQFMEALGGSMDAHSSGEGKGTTIVLRIPLGTKERPKRAQSP